MGGAVYGHDTTLRAYIPAAMETKLFDNMAVVWALGLAGETFELLAEIRLGHSRNIELECGDVLWYCAALATDLGIVEEFLAAFMELVDPHPFGVEAGLYAATGCAVERVKKAVRKHGDAWVGNIDRIAVARDLGAIARAVYWVCARHSLVWGGAMDKNLDKLRARKDAGTVGAVSR